MNTVLTTSGTVAEWQASLEAVLWAGVALGVCAGVVGCVLLSALIGLYREWRSDREGTES